MNITDLIKELETIKARDGDLSIISVHQDTYCLPISGLCAESGQYIGENGIGNGGEFIQESNLVYKRHEQKDTYKRNAILLNFNFNFN